MIQATYLKKSISQNADKVELDIQGYASLVIELTGTFVGTTVFEYTINGTDWYTLNANILGTGVVETGATAVGKWIANVAGLLKVRVRCSAYTSGPIVVALRAVPITGGSNSDKVSDKVATANTPSIATDATALAANANRKGWQIQNVGINPLFVRLGASGSNTVFHAVLKGGTGDSDGLGSSISQMSGVVYTGVITIAGTTPKYVVLEL